MADPKEQLTRAVEIVRQQTEAITHLRAENAQLKAHVADLEKAIVDQFGAHGVLICQYNDPKLSPDDRRKAATAAIAFEKAKVSAPQEHAHFHLFSHLESARLAKRQAKRKMIDVTPTPTT
jgi:cell division protein FtsB